MSELLRTLDETTRQLATLQRVARITAQDLALRPMLQRIVDTLSEEFGWEFVACASIDPGTGEFVCEALCSRIPTTISVGYRRALGSGVVGECAQSGRTIDIPDTRLHANFVETLDATLSELCVPVIHNGEVLAVLNAESLRLDAFRGQRDLLETVAGQVAGMLYAARLLDELQRANAQLQDACRELEESSRKDGLTDVGNRRCFDFWLAEAMQKATQTARPLALLVIDIDHFKAYNDHCGHIAGDDCLKLVAGLLAFMLDDLPARLARYGGEEFVVILPDADARTALGIAERLRLALVAREIPHHAAPRGILTVSIGIAATIPQSRDAGSALLQCADEALYEAKRAGRDCVRQRSFRWIASPGLAGSGDPVAARTA